jgi:hypothetical protein
MSDIQAMAFGWLLFACGVFCGATFMALAVAGDVSAAIFGAVLAGIPGVGAVRLWKERDHE